jgi:outer membrane protein assembly factor BamA
MALMPINPGEIFSRAKVAAGLDAVKRLYRSLGYINCTYVPNTVASETEHSISVEIDVEGGIFHWGDLHVEGMSEPDRRVLLQRWEGLRGQVLHEQFPADTR